MDELIRRANEDGDSNEEQETEPQSDDNDKASDESIEILQTADSTADENNSTDTAGQQSNDTTTTPPASNDRDEQDLHSETQENAETRDTDNATEIETPDDITDTSSQPAATSNTVDGKTTPSDPVETSSQTSHGDQPSLEDEKIDRLKDRASNDTGDGDNPYKASRERFKALKEKEKEQFLRRDKQNEQETTNPDSLKDKYDRYGDGNILH